MSEAIATRPTSALDTLLSDPERLKEFPIETVERLFALNREMAADVARREFAVAFNALQQSMTPVHKAAKGAHGSAYAKMEKIQGMLHPLLQASGFSYSSSMGDCPTADNERIVLTLRHVGGHAETHFYDAPIDDKGPRGDSTKTRLHGSRSTWSYCERTLLSKVCGVVETLDDDGCAGARVGPGSERITEDQVADLNAKIEELHASKRKLLAYLKIDALEDLPAIQFASAVSVLERYRSQA